MIAKLGHFSKGWFILC